MVEQHTSPRADLHTHSTASDGTLAPAELIARSARRGLRVVALTDHDTTAGVHEAQEAASRHGLHLIPGVELSTGVPRGELHILGYGIDPGDRALQDEIARFRDDRVLRAGRILDRLDDLGIELDRAFLDRIGPDASTGRPHIARAMIEAGVVTTVSEAFDRFLAVGKPAFVPRAQVEPEDAVRLIHGAGGIAVMAHPFSLPNPDEVLQRMVAAGLDGVETYYGEYDARQRASLQAMADHFRLLVTGGSDYHGPAFREGRELGSVDIPQTHLIRFLDRLGLPNPYE